MSDATESHLEVGTYRGFTIMGTIVERPTTWHVEMRVGTRDGEAFTEKLPPIIREVDKPNGALNAGLHVKGEVEAEIERALESGRLAPLL